MWDERGYGRRHRRVMACDASHNRKLAALARIWQRMIQLDSRQAPGY
jgi:hypothetical protein